MATQWATGIVQSIGVGADFLDVLPGQGRGDIHNGELLFDGSKVESQGVACIGQGKFKIKLSGLRHDVSPLR